jgi:hypothetical protein
MAMIRIPKEAEPLVKYCRPAADAVKQPFFATYADFVLFLAAYGYHCCSGKRPKRMGESLNHPAPVEIEVFQNNGERWQIVNLLGLAVTKGHDVARRMDELVAIIEDLAVAGAVELSRMLKQSNVEQFPFDLAALLAAPPTFKE